MNNLGSSIYKSWYLFLLCLSAIVILNTVSVSAEAIGMSNYRLGSGDKIQINVFDEEELSVEIMLGDTGIINYPFLGEIKVTGLTINQIESLISNGLKPDYLINPSVQVSVVEYRPFFIDGEVNSPGGYPYQPGLNVSKAVALAGGFTERASKNSIYVTRASAGSKNSKAKPVKVSLSDPIYPGDIMTIEESFF